MMNKKAIAAFAAGATLLAGFAMATPVFAADAQAPKNDQNLAAPKNDQNPKKKDSESTDDKIHALKLADTKAELGKKKTALTTAATGLNNAVQAVQKAKNSVPSATIQQGNTGATKQGQAGANGAAAGAKTTVVEKKKDGGKKLPGTGVGVTLTALAATMLAGMGAAVRKARH